MNLELRDVSEAEAELICEIFATSFTATFGHLYPPEDLAIFMEQVNRKAFAREIGDPAFRFQLATVDGQPAGFAKVGPPGLPGWSPASTRELRQLYVLGTYLGTGAGKALMHWAMKDAKAGGGRHLQLSVYADNERAKRFYAKHGFVEIGPYKFMVGNHADQDVIMRAKL